jgi:hypothetical protein
VEFDKFHWNAATGVSPSQPVLTDSTPQRHGAVHERFPLAECRSRRSRSMASSGPFVPAVSITSVSPFPSANIQCGRPLLSRSRVRGDAVCRSVDSYCALCGDRSRPRAATQVRRISRGATCHCDRSWSGKTLSGVQPNAHWICRALESVRFRTVLNRKMPRLHLTTGIVDRSYWLPAP